ncbi:SET domain-containing protein SmydA-8-like [Rhodnius prolixus]|uniref:SET domain-containing protein n=1 Tax=Rhodnius prolixus TaxID=13249 RepID=T1HXB3_RHOPR
MVSKFFVKKNNKVGRYCTAACHLSAGEAIFCEEAFSVGPKSGSPLLCLGCHKALDEVKTCNKCRWPVCNEECSKQEIHSKNECAIFSSVGVKFNLDGDASAQLECITVLRTLLESERDATRWNDEVVVLEDHTNDRKARPEFWSAEQINVVDFLYEKCKLRSRFKKDTIQKVCGILEVNCFEVITEEYSSIRGLYPKLAIMSHNCVANTTHSKILNEHKMIVRTTVAVKEGDELYSSYTRSTESTLLRRVKLWDSKFFHCQCQRCSDPTELGTHLNTLKCTKCDNGLIFSADPLDNDAPWNCNLCDNAITAAGVQKVYKVVQDELEELEQIPFGPEKIEAAEKRLKQYKSFLHPRHAFKLALWHELMLLYGRAEGYSLDMLPDILLERKAEMCRNLLQTYDVIEPGYTRVRGVTLYELHVALLLYNRSQYEYRVLTLDKFKAEMKKVADILEESGKILSLEPEGSQEFTIGLSALNSVAQLRESVEKLKEESENKIDE